MSKDELLALAERCEKAEGRDRTLEQDIHDAVLGRDYLANSFQRDGSRIARYTASLDAAMTLVPEGWDWARDIDAIFCLYPPESTSPEIGFHPTCPALALCAAALRARAAMQEQQP